MAGLHSSLETLRDLVHYICGKPTQPGFWGGYSELTWLYAVPGQQTDQYRFRLGQLIRFGSPLGGPHHSAPLSPHCSASSSETGGGPDAMEWNGICSGSTRHLNSP